MQQGAPFLQTIGTLSMMVPVASVTQSVPLLVHLLGNVQRLQVRDPRPVLVLLVADDLQSLLTVGTGLYHLGFCVFGITDGMEELILPPHPLVVGMCTLGGLRRFQDQFVGRCCYTVCYPKDTRSRMDTALIPMQACRTVFLTEQMVQSMSSLELKAFELRFKVVSSLCMNKGDLHFVNDMKTDMILLENNASTIARTPAAPYSLSFDSIASPQIPAVIRHINQRVNTQEGTLIITETAFVKEELVAKLPAHHGVVIIRSCEVHSWR